MNDMKLSCCNAGSGDWRPLNRRQRIARAIVGAGLLGLAGELPWKDRIVLLSGRASFELLQKAMMAGAPLVAAIGAPSTLAVELAETAGITLVAFLRPGGCNVYCNAWRVAGANRES